MVWQVTWFEITESNGTFGNKIGTSEFKDLGFIFRWGGGGVFEGKTDNIGFRATTMIIPLTNKLDITIGSDDGSRLMLDDKIVIDYWGLHGLRWKQASIDAIPFKPTKLTYEWYEWTGAAAAEFYYEKEQIQELPAGIMSVDSLLNVLAVPFISLGTILRGPFRGLSSLSGNLGLGFELPFPKKTTYIIETEEQSPVIGAASALDEEVEIF